MRQFGVINLEALRRRPVAGRRFADGDLATSSPSPAAPLVSFGASAWDEAAFWLTAAAEIEHALMVQYLYSAYSLDIVGSDSQEAQVKNIQQRLLQVAREEMGHLITVENLLILIGAPLHFGREHSPYASDIYPFRFKLEKLTLASLAKYVVAESPDAPADEIPGLKEEDRILLAGEIEQAALLSNDGEPIRHVGPIYHRLRAIFEHELADTAFRLGRGSHQARWEDWGFEGRSSTGGLEVLVHHFDHPDATSARTAAVAAIRAIGDQGEAADEDEIEESHFERFLSIYKDYKSAAQSLGRDPVWPVVRDPNVSASPPQSYARGHMVEAVLEQRRREGQVTQPRTRLWAQLFNLRYRLLLGCLHHSFLRPEPSFEANGDRTARGVLQLWTFGEMRRVRKLAEKLVALPLRADSSEPHAGPPFELPYALSMSSFEEDRWRAHAAVLEEALALAAELLAGTDAGDPFLEHLLASDTFAKQMADVLADGLPLPDAVHATDYAKTLAILDEAVRGFDFAPRHSTNSGGLKSAFWHGVTRDQFLALTVSGQPIVQPGNPSGSQLLARIDRPAGDPLRMPRYRPRIPQTRIDALRDWIAAGAPDGPPSTTTEPEPSPRLEPRPAPVSQDQAAALSFARDIRPLFRDFDRESMSVYFDLFDHASVKARADDILQTLEDGSMPCDGAWPPEQIEMFRRWMDAGAPE